MPNAFDLEIREGTRGASAKVLLTLSFANGRANLSDIETVTWVFKSKKSGEVVSLAGAVHDAALMVVSLTLAAGDWTTFADDEKWTLTVDLLTIGGASRIPVPEGSLGFLVKFYPHPTVPVPS
jgi:hypothetical protein